MPPSPIPPSDPSGKRPFNFGMEMNSFWQRVSDGLQIEQLCSQFSKDAQASYRLYRRDMADRAPEQPTRKPGFFHTLYQFLWAILEKLSPARRILLLLALLLLIMPGGGFRYHN